jgi:hypothetical protein
MAAWFGRVVCSSLIILKLLAVFTILSHTESTTLCAYGCSCSGLNRCAQDVKYRQFVNGLKQNCYASLGCHEACDYFGATNGDMYPVDCLASYLGVSVKGSIIFYWLEKDGDSRTSVSIECICVHVVSATCCKLEPDICLICKSDTSYMQDFKHDNVAQLNSQKPVDSSRMAKNQCITCYVLNTAFFRFAGRKRTVYSKRLTLYYSNTVATQR